MCFNKREIEIPYSKKSIKKDKLTIYINVPVLYNFVINGIETII